MIRFVPLTQALGTRQAPCSQPKSAIRRQGKAEPALRVHVIGCPGSGVTLMTELLRHAYPFAGAALHEQSLFDPAAVPAYPHLSRSSADTPHIGDVFAADAELFVIAMVRDPRAIIAGKYAAAAKAAPGSAGRGALGTTGFEQWRQAIAAIKQLTPKVRCLQVSYEALVANPVSVQEQIEAQFGFLRREQSFASYPCQSARKLEAIWLDASAVQTQADTWRTQLSGLRRELDRHPDLAEWVVATGYEANCRWTRLLGTVEPAPKIEEPWLVSAAKNLATSLRYWWRARRYLAQRTKLGAIPTAQ